MPNIKSAKKRVRTIEKRSILNNDLNASMKTAIKKVEKAVKEGNIEQANKNLVVATKKIDTACAKGIIKPNARDRYKSRITKLINKK